MLAVDIFHSYNALNDMLFKKLASPTSFQFHEQIVYHITLAEQP